MTFGAAHMMLCAHTWACNSVSWSVDGGRLSVTTGCLGGVSQGLLLAAAIWWAADTVTDEAWLIVLLTCVACD